MNRGNIEALHRELVDAACRLMEEVAASEHSILEGLPGGNRLLVEIAILPPAAEFDEGARAARPPSEMRPLSGEGCAI
jgi:hypothetical protein